MVLGVEELADHKSHRRSDGRLMMITTTVIILLSSQKVVLTPITMRRINAPLLNKFYIGYNVVVSERKGRDLTKRFDDTSVDWVIIKATSCLGRIVSSR